jgi:hypothetical protein
MMFSSVVTTPPTMSNTMTDYFESIKILWKSKAIGLIAMKQVRIGDVVRSGDAKCDKISQV